MKRISTATKVVDKFGAGKPGFTNGNAVTGIASTDLESDWFDHVQEEISNVIEATGGAVDGSAYTQLLTAIRTMIRNASALPGVRGLRGDRNAAAPTTKYDFTCAQRIYRNPGTGDIIISRSAATISADAAVAGPVAGGRDQVGAFAAGWLNLFFLIDAAGNETAVWSANAPTVGPVMFGAYVSWVFGHSAYWTGAAFRRCTMRGSRYFEASWQSILTVGNTSGTEVVANCATAWPAWAQLGVTRIKSYISSNTGGGGTATASWRFLSAFAGKDVDMGCAQASDTAYYNEECVFPNVGQQLLCALTLTGGAGNLSAVSSLLQGVGFTVSNGDA